jgi:hypothetical protein
LDSELILQLAHRGEVLVELDAVRFADTRHQRRALIRDG